MVRQESRGAAEFEKLHAELAKQIDRLDFRSESSGPAHAKMAQHVERTNRRLTR